MTANVETMMWTGNFETDMPWHMSPERFYGYGGVDPASAEDTIRLAKLDWGVALHPAAVEVAGSVYKSDEIFHIVRDQDYKILGTCTERYIPIQNKEAFNFLDGVVGDLDQRLRYVTAGAIDGGKRIWLLAQLLGDEFEIEPVANDRTKMFLMLTTGHDGANSLRCKFTSVRIVCQNTLNLALRSGGDGVCIKHIGDPMKKLQQAREILGLATSEADDFKRISAWLASQRTDASYINDFLEAMAPTEGKTKHGLTRAENIQKDLLHLSIRGKGTHISGVLGTRWSLLNAVTEYNTHERNYKNTKQSGQDTNKFDALFSGGVAEKMNQKALDFLLADAPDAIYKAPKKVTREID